MILYFIKIFENEKHELKKRSRLNTLFLGYLHLTFTINRITIKINVKVRNV